MSDIEQVQEQMKADMEAMKRQMTTMMEAMMSMRKMMQVNVTIVSTACTITKRDPTHTPDFNQENHPVLDMGGQGGATTANAYELHCVQVQSGPFFPPYGLPLNYTLLTTVYVPGEKIASFAPVFIEN